MGSACAAIHVLQAAASLHAGSRARIGKFSLRGPSFHMQERGGGRSPASVEHALLAVGVVFRLGQSDGIAEHEVIVGADAGRRAHEVAGPPSTTGTPAVV